MNVWLIGATALLAGLLPCGWVLLRGRLAEALVGLELASTLVTVVLVLLAEGFHRSSYFTLPLVLAHLRRDAGLHPLPRGPVALTVDILVALGVAVELVCCVGLLAMRSAIDRILLRRSGDGDELRLRGRAGAAPMAGLAFLLGGLGLAGLPPFGRSPAAR